MACPYFVPERELEERRWTHAPRAPLGAIYGGSCAARPGEPYMPGESRQIDLCNFGYARGVCGRFPGDPAAADAIRFSVAEDQGGQLRLVRILEKDHAPASHESLEIPLDGGGELQSAAMEDGQMRAFLQNYLRRRTRGA